MRQNSRQHLAFLLAAICISLLQAQQHGQVDFSQYNDYDEETMYANAINRSPEEQPRHYELPQPQQPAEHRNTQHYDATSYADPDAETPRHYVLPQPHESVDDRMANNRNTHNYATYQHPGYPAESSHIIQPEPSSQQDNAGRHDSMDIHVPRVGLVRGLIGYKTIKNRPINAFLGLKYGKVLPGLGRFQKALEPEYSGSYINATVSAPNCPQFPELQRIIEAENRGEDVNDCLTLDIYAPKKSGSYPVLVYVHGEMLFDGGSEEGQPDYFLEHDVILVNINYRLAPLGFLTTLSDNMPGNVALADIHMALEWIQTYITHFNGNRDQVTLMGQAGGATLVHALAISGKAQGLFHKLILQSGTALNPYFLDEDPLTTLRTFLRYAHCPSTREDLSSATATCFARMKTSDLINAFKKHWEDYEPRGMRFTGGFKLVVGDKLGYLPQHPAAMVAANTYPTIVGVAKDAGAFIMSRFYKQLTEVRSRNISDYIGVVLKHTTQPRHYNLWKNLALREIFTQDEIQQPSLNKVAQSLLELTNMILYRAPVIDSIRYTSKNFSTYMYCFDYRGRYHRFGHLESPYPFGIDATLSDDNIYLFPYPEEVSRLNAEDMSIARSLTTMWVNFAIYDKPNFSDGVWPKVNSEYGPFLRMTNNQQRNLELDQHFGDGIPVPNLYPEYFTTSSSSSSSSSTTTSTTARTPYQPYQQSYGNNMGRPYPRYQNGNSYARYSPPHETVLHNGEHSPNPYQPHSPSYAYRQNPRDYNANTAQGDAMNHNNM